MAPWVRLVILFVMLLLLGTMAWARAARERECRERGGEWETRPRPGHCVPRPLSYPGR